MAYKILSRHADTVGDGSGTHNAIGNYAGDPTEFKISAAPGEYINLTRCIVSMQSSTLNQSDIYGDGGALTNGIDCYVTDSLGVIQYYLTDENVPIKTNAEWAHLCYDYSVHAGFAAGSDFVVIRWTWAHSGKEVELLPGWSVNFLCQDDLRTVTSKLTDHHFFVQGWYQLPTVGADVGHA